jgi:hypothetical protein
MRGAGLLAQLPRANKRPALAFFSRETLGLSSGHHPLPLLSFPNDETGPRIYIDPS